MGECNLDNIEREELRGPEYPEIANAAHFRLRLASTVDDDWRCEIPSTGENGNVIASGCIENERTEEFLVKNKVINRVLKYFEILGKIEAD
jgi:hypothetical protein